MAGPVTDPVEKLVYHIKTHSDLVTKLKATIHRMDGHMAAMGNAAS